MFIKTKEFNQNDNDIYFMEVLSDKIIINDNYDGILILDNNLNLIKRLKLFEDITVYSSFINNNEEILLFCPDNECMVHINIANYEYKVIYLRNGLENLIFSTLYEWNENALILTTYKGEFYKVCVYEKTMQKIDYKEIERLYPKLYEFHQESIKHKVVKVFADEYIAIIDDEKCNINMLNFKDQTKQVLNNATANFLDIEFRAGAFAIVNENTIEIITTRDKGVMYPNKDCIFLKARFLGKPNDIFLVTLSSSQSNVNYSKIDMFQLWTL
ncbi:hypothetical protein KPL40_05370 [Clostridium gasigenes]|uniref:hypothetical protein n=1 Tax=Clostridium gasigenes TaxID=94869 RepID=UPI001C0C82FE|nr:hypothetical protein [Clostridium gasigenes]MBU3131876.1 hypothetical protein [Clostridium gasigenes]